MPVEQMNRTATRVTVVSSSDIRMLLRFVILLMIFEYCQFPFLSSSGRELVWLLTHFKQNNSVHVCNTEFTFESLMIKSNRHSPHCATVFMTGVRVTLKRFFKSVLIQSWYHHCDNEGFILFSPYYQIF